MQYTPLGNSTHPCSGLEEREQSRPPLLASSLYHNFGVGLFGVVTAALVVALGGILWYRDHPRFDKVRTLPQSVLALVAIWFYVSGGTIAIAQQWPCAYIISAQCLGMAALATTIMMRCLITSLEAQYAKLASATRVLNIEAETESVATSTDGGGGLSFSLGQGSVQFFKRQFAATRILFRLVTHIVPISSMTIQELVLAKSGYAIFAVSFFLPAVWAVLGVIFAVPPVFECPTQCHEIFLEAELVLLCLVAYFFVFDLATMLAMYQYAGWDDKGVLMEVTGIVVAVCGCGIVTIALAIADPGNVDFNREFSWQSLVGFTGLFNIWFSFGWQLLIVQLQNRKARREDKAAAMWSVIAQMTQILHQHPELKQEFDKFAAKQYVSESVQFLDDVAQFKHLYYDKPESWRAQKVRILVRNYIMAGSDLEVNISSAARGLIIERALGGRIGGGASESFDLFDVAVVQVRDMVQNGVWRDFVRNRELPSYNSQTSQMASKAVSPNTPKLLVIAHRTGSFLHPSAVS
ncbi:hypothetical protein BASA81_011044 [Batrachochytrium salamandrivorans]|nr:hypothetical protein BASA81_011044 [Batrachochytrium salamandrivorans]